MNSIFEAEETKGGIVTHVFAEITKRDSGLIIRPLTEMERRKMNEYKYGEKLPDK